MIRARKRLWYRIEELPEYPLPSLQVIFEMITRMKTYGFPAPSRFLVGYVKGGGWFCSDAASWDAASRAALRLMHRHPQRYARIYRNLRRIGVALDQLAARLERINLRAASAAQLLRWYERVHYLGTELHLMRCPGWLVEQRDELLTKSLLRSLSRHIRATGSSIDPVAAFAALTASSERGRTAEEEQALLRLAVQRRVPAASLLRHLRRYWYLTYGTVGPGMTMTELRRRLVKLQRGDPRAALRRRRQEYQSHQRHQRMLLKQLRLPRALRETLTIAQRIAFGKAWSKEIQFRGYAARDAIGRELSRRTGLTLRRFLWLFPSEVRELVESGQRLKTAELDRRREKSWLLFSRQGWRFLNLAEQRAFFASNVLEKPDLVDRDVREVRGTPAVVGQAHGTVSIINAVRDMGKMKEGNILVSDMTIPEIVPAMRKAAAIVTNVGGLTCHAAIVARELRIPCVIGTKIATAVFRDGDRVEVDAEKGIVRKLP